LRHNINAVSKEIIQLVIIDRAGNSAEYEAPTDMSMNLMEVCKAHELPVAGTCGGMGLCSSCHIYIESGHTLPEMSADEEAQLDNAFFVQENSRLGCQLTVNEDMDGLIFRLAPTSN
jgi:ferredoxin